MIETLEQYTDNDLKGLIAEAQTILEAHDQQRKQQAMRRIRSITTVHGLSIEARKSGKKRWRPAKAANGNVSNGT